MKNHWYLGLSSLMLIKKSIFREIIILILSGILIETNLNQLNSMILMIFLMTINMIKQHKFHFIY